MSVYQRILVVIDPLHNEQPALTRALFLAEKYQSQITIVSCIYDPNYDYTNLLGKEERKAIKSALIAHEQEQLNELLTRHDLSELTNTMVVWHKKLYQGIIDTAQAHHCDLIIKSTKQHNKLGQRIFTPNDWKLLRNSPVNVLMVKNHDWPINGNIVAALSVENIDSSHECLSELVSDESKNIATLVQANLHLANSFAGAPVHISVEVPTFSAQAYNANLQERHEELIGKIASNIHVEAQNIHVTEGLPEDVIPSICHKLDAQLLVLGSVGRSGLSAALLGNTAEHIIDKLNCDTLVIKPQS